MLDPASYRDRQSSSCPRWGGHLSTPGSRTANQTTPSSSRIDEGGSGITATVVSDIATHDTSVPEKTLDFYAQDEQETFGTSEDTTAFLPNGKTDTSGSFLAGVEVP